jgi:Kef-type K+ transport system membrane component KefB
VTEAAVLLHVLLAMIVVAGVAQVTGTLFARVRQPAVVGEMIAGVLLGPSLFGRVAPAAARFLFPTGIVPALRGVAQLGVVLFMFLVGLELDMRRLGARTRAALTMALAGIVVPLGLGAGVALWLSPVLAPSVDRLLFTAFFAIAMSVTAFPVLARIVAERRLSRSPLGIMALTCAAMGDVTAWCLLAIVVSLASGKHGSGLATLGLTAAYVGAMLVVVRPLTQRLAARQETAERLSRRTVATLFLGLLLSALVTEWIGIHALFGAFLLGAVVPSETQLARQLTDKLEDLVGVVLLPVFFAFTGIRTDLHLVSGLQAWLLCALILSVAFLGKLGGVSVTARLLGVSWRHAAALGVLMNTRGLMELVVLNVGLDLGIVSPSLFAMMVVMAFVTTLAAGPLLDVIGRAETSGDHAGEPRPGTS